MVLIIDILQYISFAVNGFNIDKVICNIGIDKDGGL